MKRGILAGALGLAMLAGPAAAQPIEPDPVAGLELAEQLCSVCHIVGTERVGSDAAPPFPVIAKDPETTLTELHGWDGPGHPLLPNLALTTQQIADINAYLDSLHDAVAPAPDETPAPPEGAAPRTDTEAPPPALQDSPPEQIGPPIGAPTE